MRLDDETLSALKQIKVSGNQTTMPMFDRKLYVKVNKALECLGGKWQRGQQAHVWDCDPGDPIADAVMTGEVRDWRKELQFFPTPDELAQWIVTNAEIHSCHKVLEPSAGEGNILKFIPELSGVEITAVEINPDMAQRLTNTGRGWDPLRVRIIHGDFLEMDGELGQFDRIVMNPPFSKGQDIAHVKHAYDKLKPDGILVAITSPGWTFRTDSKHKAFRDWINDIRGVWRDIPEGTFKSSGTMVRTVSIVIHKAGS